jgi:hypothetical protein
MQIIQTVWQLLGLGRPMHPFHDVHFGPFTSKESTS